MIVEETRVQSVRIKYEYSWRAIILVIKMIMMMIVEMIVMVLVVVVRVIRQGRWWRRRCWLTAHTTCCFDCRVEIELVGSVDFYHGWRRRGGGYRWGARRCHRWRRRRWYTYEIIIITVYRFWLFYQLDLIVIVVKYWCCCCCWQCCCRHFWISW